MRIWTRTPCDLQLTTHDPFARPVAASRMRHLARFRDAESPQVNDLICRFQLLGGEGGYHQPHLLHPKSSVDHENRSPSLVPHWSLADVVEEVRTKWCPVWQTPFTSWPRFFFERKDCALFGGPSSSNRALEVFHPALRGIDDEPKTFNRLGRLAEWDRIRSWREACVDQKAPRGPQMLVTFIRTIESTVFPSKPPKIRFFLWDHLST